MVMPSWSGGLVVHSMSGLDQTCGMGVSVLLKLIKRLLDRNIISVVAR